MNPALRLLRPIQGTILETRLGNGDPMYEVCIPCRVTRTWEQQQWNYEDEVGSRITVKEEYDIWKKGTWVRRGNSQKKVKLELRS